MVDGPNFKGHSLLKAVAKIKRLVSSSIRTAAAGGAD